MNCNQVSYFLIDYIDLNLDEKTHQEVKTHLDKCSTCSEELMQNKEMISSIENTKDQMPGVQLKNIFNEMLVNEKAGLAKSEHGKKTSIFIKYKMAWQMAAAVLLLFTGYLAGYNSNNTVPENEKLITMQNDVTEMKQMMALSLLNNESASQRIKAVNYTEELQQPNNKIIEALINTLNTDKNSNVRLAAIYSLARFKNNKLVQEAFIHTLNMQDDPMVQIVIINLLVEMEEVRAADELKKLLQNKDLYEEVKTQAEIGVKILS